MSDILKKTTHVFDGLSNDELRILLGVCVEEVCDNEKIILKKNYHNQYLYYIKEGFVNVVIRDKVIATLGPGSVFGEMEWLDGIPSSSDIVANGEVKILTLSYKEIELLSETNTRIFTVLLRNIVKDVSLRLRNVNNKIIKLLSDKSSKVLEDD